VGPHRENRFGPFDEKVVNALVEGENLTPDCLGLVGSVGHQVSLMRKLPVHPSGPSIDKGARV
jgi:hypothetical protein